MAVVGLYLALPHYKWFLLTRVKTHTLGNRFLGFAEGFFVPFSVFLPNRNDNKNEINMNKKTIITILFALGGTNETKREELLTKIKEAEAE